MHSSSPGGSAPAPSAADTPTARPQVAARRGATRRFLSEDLPRWLERTFFEAPHAPAAVEIDATQVVLAVARRPKDARPQVTALRAHPLPEGLVRPSPLQPNVADAAALAQEVRRLFAGMSPPGMVSLVIPDGAAKVGILELEALPKSRRDALELVRFRLKKTVPFRIEEAQVDFQPLSVAPRRVRLLTAVIHRPILEQYTAAVEALGAQPGLVTLSTLALAERCVPAAAEDVLLANVTPQTLTLSVSRKGEIVLFRCKVLPAPGQASDEERRLAARREWQATISYYQEKLSGGGFSRALARLVGWKPADLLEPDEVGRLERIEAEGWAEPAPGLTPPSADAALFAPALALALRGAA
jgi:hypothetical protein